MDTHDFRELERELQQHWKDDEGEDVHPFVEQAWSPIRESLTTKALAEGVELKAFESRLYRARLLAKNLFEALHQGLIYRQYSRGIKPSSYWHHQQFEPLRANDEKRGICIDKSELSATAARYLSQAELQTNAFDWYLLDALVFAELDAFAYHSINTKMGTGFNWALAFSEGSQWKYLLYSFIFGLVGFVLRYVALPALAMYLFYKGHEGFGLTIGAIWILLVGWRLIGIPFRWRAKRKHTELLNNLLSVYTELDGNTLSPRRLRDLLDKAASAGVVLDGAIFSLVDRMMRRDATAFVRW